MSAGARTALRRFVLERNPDLDPQALDDHTPLISSRLVTSLHLVDLLLVVESLARAPVDLRRMTPDSFRSIDVIVATFLPEST